MTQFLTMWHTGKGTEQDRGDQGEFEAQCLPIRRRANNRLSVDPVLIAHVTISFLFILSFTRYDMKVTAHQIRKSCS